MKARKHLIGQLVLLSAAAVLGWWLALESATAPAAGMQATGIQTARHGTRYAFAPAHPGHGPHEHEHAAGPPTAPSRGPATGHGAVAAAAEQEQYFPRDPEEWQGLRVRSDVVVPCDRKDGCNLGLACIDGTCKPCGSDMQCAAGEACTLDHCLPAAQVTCRSRHDCGDSELCFLSSYEGSTGRMNEGMHAYCSSIDGENPFARIDDRELDYAQDVPGVQFTPEELGPPHELAARLKEQAREHFGEPDSE